MDLELTPLPGIGMRHSFVTEQGRRVGVVVHHIGGHRDLVHDDGVDPDSMCSVTLTRTEAFALARLLGVIDVVAESGCDALPADPKDVAGRS